MLRLRYDYFGENDVNFYKIKSYIKMLQLFKKSYVKLPFLI